MRAFSPAQPPCSRPAALMGGSGSSLPSGAIGAWYADEYISTPRKQLPNAVNPITSSNLISAPNRLFNNTTVWAKTSLTVSDGVVAGPDGKNNASTVVWGSSDAYLQQAMTLAAGTYTVAVDVATTDAATVNVRTGTSSSMATVSVDGTWKSISHTFSHAGGGLNVLPIRSVNASTPANLKIANVRLFAGSTDLGAEAMTGQLLLGRSEGTSQPTVTSGKLDEGTWFGMVQFADDLGLDEYTAICLCKRNTTGVNEQAFLSKAQSYTDLTMQMASSLKAGQHIAGANPYSPKAGLWQPKTGKWDVIVNRREGTSGSILINGSNAYSATRSGTITVQDFFVNILVSTSFPSSYDMAAIVLYDRPLTDAEVYQATVYLEGRFSALSPRTHEAFILVEGDSNSSDAYATSYANTQGPSLATEAIGVVKAVSGSWLDVGSIKVTDRAAAEDAMIPANKNGTKYVYSLMIGTNDGLGYSGGYTAYAAVVAAFLQARKAAGWDYTVLCTVFPKTSPANFNADFQTPYNSLITGAGWAAANGVDAVVDFTTVSQSLDASNATYYSDGTHATQALQNLLAPVWGTAIDGLL